MEVTHYEKAKDSDSMRLRLRFFLMLRMNVETIAKQHNVEIEAFCGDVATCCANDCDVIFISKELAQRIEGRAKVPIVVFNNFMNKQEVEEKTLTYFETLK